MHHAYLLLDKNILRSIKKIFIFASHLDSAHDVRPCIQSVIFCLNPMSTGMFQRLDKLRKNAFASVILFGKNNDSSISGIWVFRGHDLAFPVSI